MAIVPLKSKAGKITGYRVFVDLGTLPNGKRNRPSKKCATKKEALAIDARMRVQKETNQGHSNHITFKDFVELFWLPEKEETLRQNTIKGYKRDLNLRLTPAFGDILIADINRSRIQSMIDRCGTYKIGKNARDTLSAVLGYAVDMEFLERNPARLKYKYKAKPEISKGLGAVITSHAEHMRLINLADDFDTKAILVLGLCFGLRKGEILGLDWQDIDFKNRIIHITKTYTKGNDDITPPKTPKSRRDLPMSNSAHVLLKELRSWGRVTRATGPILKNKAGNRLSHNTIYTRIKDFREEHNLPDITPSSLRHSFATAWVLAGGNVASLSKWLGHTNTSTTMNRYVIPLMGDLKADTEMLDQAYSKAANL